MTPTRAATAERDAALDDARGLAAHRAADHRRGGQGLRHVRLGRGGADCWASRRTSRRTRGGGAGVPSTGGRSRHAGYLISQRKRKLVEQVFGWMKTVGLLRKLRHRGGTARRVDLHAGGGGLSRLLGFGAGPGRVEDAHRRRNHPRHVADGSRARSPRWSSAPGCRTASRTVRRPAAAPRRGRRPTGSRRPLRGCPAPSRWPPPGWPTPGLRPR